MTDNNHHLQYKKHLSEPWFSLLKIGLKKVEGRICQGDFSRMKKNDIVVFYNDDIFHREIRTKIKYINYYKSFIEYLETESLDRCLPGIDSVTDGLNVYYKFYSQKDENEKGVIAIRFKLID